MTTTATATAPAPATTPDVLTQHPFERAGLGLAPFRCVGVVTKVGPIVTVVDGIQCEVGSPGQPMGTCDYCGTGIKDCYIIRSADAKQFVVGCDCVAKVARADNRTTLLAAEVEKFKRQLKADRAEETKARAAAKLKQRIAAALATLTGMPTLLVDVTHPHEGLAAKGLTMRDYVLWNLKNNYNGRTVAKCVRAVADAAKVPADPAKLAEQRAIVERMEAQQRAVAAERDARAAAAEARRIAEDAAKANHVHVGTPSVRLRNLPVTLTRVIVLPDNGYGVRFIVGLADAQGNPLVWFTANPPVSREDVGTSYLLTATVKDHSEYKGEKQTSVRRAVLVPVPVAAGVEG